ncbi:hypothetical protein C8Q76DRAFT_697500 [Earliella scabrosa]|nr:hypothetical protein C8Q76DRAFT_697500 [Earliella scabrosa]
MSLGEAVLVNFDVQAATQRITQLDEEAACNQLDESDDDEEDAPTEGSILLPATLASVDKAERAPTLFGSASKRHPNLTAAAIATTLPRVHAEKAEDGMSREQFHKKHRRAMRKARRSGTAPYERDPSGLRPNVKPQAWTKFQGAIRHAQASGSLDRGDRESGEPDPGRGIVVVDLDTSMKDVPVASTAHVGARMPAGSEDRASIRLEDLERLGIQVVHWDGRDTRPVVTPEGLIPVIAAGRPTCERYDRDVNTMSQICEEIRGAYAFNPNAKANRRGEYRSVSIGVSFGGGQTVVKNLSHAPQNMDVVDAILSHEAVHRIANFGSHCMKMYAPRMFCRYGLTLDVLLQQDSRLRRNFHGNHFACMTLNLGPNTVTSRHTDHLNVPWGWCAITAFGTYDYKQGGHLILWDLGIAFEFPPGATILIPSAILAHSNAAIQPGETRYSLTQYTAGGLFRWVECGLQSQKSFDAAGMQASQTPEERWKEGLKTWSTWNELLDLCAAPPSVA